MQGESRHTRRELLAGSLGALAVPAAATKRATSAGAPPYGTLDGRTPQAGGLLIPEGFTSRVVARSGEPVADTGYVWPAYPDGAATFPDGSGGWFYVCNSEVVELGAGGVSAIHFDADGSVTDAYSVLAGTTANCAGGPTPWGTWLSCEEMEHGLVWECDPTGRAPGVSRPALGAFIHEAAAVDPIGECVYMTEDAFDGLLYRFVPERYPDLTAGTLQAAQVAPDGSVTWLDVPDPSGTETALTRHQLLDATIFNGGEGMWYHEGEVVFTTKGDDRVHVLDTAADRHRVVYDRAVAGETAPLSGVDNVTVEVGSGDAFVAEDGGNLELVVLSPDGTVAPFCRLVGAAHKGSEVTGPCFAPGGRRLYFSSQRGGGDGITFEVSGPFRGAGAEASAAPSFPTPTSRVDSSGTSPALPIALGVGGGGVVAVAAAAIMVRRRRVGPAE